MATPPPLPLNKKAMLGLMADTLPHNAGGADAPPDLASSHEAVALLVHAYFTALGFVLCGFSEDKPFSEEEAALAPRLLSSWNAGIGAMGFVYSHKQSAMRFVIRIDRMGAKLEIRGLAVGADKIYRVERSLHDLIKPASLPLRIPLKLSGDPDRDALLKRLDDLFVSDSANQAFLRDLKIKIVQNLIPKLQREGYVEEGVSEEASVPSTQTRGTPGARGAQGGRNPSVPAPSPSTTYPQRRLPEIRPHPLPQMARPRPGVPTGEFPPPTFDDEYQMNYPMPGFIFPDGRSPLNIGHDDLNPPGLGPHDPLQGSFVPSGGYPQSTGPSGMYPTFDDPIFHQPGTGGNGYHPHAPPGARWDPTGPGGGPRQGGPGAGQGYNPYGGGGFGGGGGGII